MGEVDFLYQSKHMKKKEDVIQKMVERWKMRPPQSGNSKLGKGEI